MRKKTLSAKSDGKATENAPPKAADVGSAQKHRDRMARRSREAFASVSEIGPIPPPKDPKRRGGCTEGPDWLLNALNTYFAESFSSPFSADHVAYIRRLQDVIDNGGRDLQVVYRGFGKTTIAECTVLMAALKRRRRVIVLLGADDTAAQGNLENLKTELECNEALAEDFPEACLPIRALEGKNQRVHAQTCEGELTHITWKGDHITLPTVYATNLQGKRERFCGTTIIPKGFMVCRRGIVKKTPDGQQLRPDLVLFDDAQTDASARSPYQVRLRIEKLYRTITKLAGHRKPLAIFGTGTILRPGDMIDQLLDDEQHPSWRANRCQMVLAWSDAHDSHWLGPYADILRNFDRADPTDRRRARKRAKDFYTKHRKVMDAGAKVAWEHCFSGEKDEISAVQHAYNMLIEDGFDAFQSECQNEPDTGADDQALSASAILLRTSGVPRGQIPIDAAAVTAHVDVQGKLLYWMVVAWGSDFTGWIVDWGAWPDQQSNYWSLSDARFTLRRKYKTTEEGSIFQGLDDLTKALLSRRFKQCGGTGEHSIRLLLVDSAWSTKNIYSWHARSEYRGLILPSRGRGIRAKDRPISEWTPQKGDRLGHEWIITRPGKASRLGQLLIYDANHWKTRVNAGLLLPVGTRESITLPKAKPAELQLPADQFVSERGQRVTTAERTKIEWALPGHRPDNHLWDTLVGAAAAASVCGINTASDAIPAPKRSVRRKVRYL